MSQKEGQEDQGTLKALQRPPLALLPPGLVLLAFFVALAWPPWNSIKLA